MRCGLHEREETALYSRQFDRARQILHETKKKPRSLVEKRLAEEQFGLEYILPPGGGSIKDSTTSLLTYQGLPIGYITHPRNS